MTDRAKLRSEHTVEISQELHEMARRTIELVYFAHIDQADWADHVLAKHGIGRPHHRVLYFSNRFPGISVRELMVILRITNQALARTTTQLVTLGFLEQRYSPSDRRVRQHFLSKEGESLLAKLTRHQVEQLAKSMNPLSRNEIDALWFCLEKIIRPEDLRWLLPRPQPIAHADEIKAEPDRAEATVSGSRSIAGNGSGHPGRIYPLAKQDAGITWRRK